MPFLGVLWWLRMPFGSLLLKDFTKSVAVSIFHAGDLHFTSVVLQVWLLVNLMFLI